MAEQLVFAKSVADAASLKNADSVYLAGGTEINRLDSCVKAKTLISLSKLGLKDISECKVENSDFKYLKIGAMCTFQELIDNPSVPSYLKQACLFMSSRQKRDMATIGGNIANCRDDSYLLSALLAVDALVEVYTSWKKKIVICLSNYIENRMESNDELLLSVFVPAEGFKVALKRYSNTAAGHGYLTVAVSGVEDDITVAVCAKNSGIYTFCNEKVKGIKFKDDIFGSPEYKKYLLEVTVEDLVAKVRGGAK